MGLQTSGIVIENRRIKTLYFLLEIHCPPIAAKIRPGQFVMLEVSDNHHPFLRRPFSVYRSFPNHYSEKKKRGRLFILYKKVGKGTQKMTEFEEGQRVDMIGPLGNGFTLPPFPSSTNIILVGGGVGIVSLYPLAEVLATGKLFVFIGGKTRNDILCSADFKKLDANIFIATEDGSLGPVGMLKELKRTIRFEQFICQASLESRMGCGFGACWGCVVKTSDPRTPYQRVCKEGPVFNLKDIVWE
jgi:dihydroorotate dehydrogenase electron transfer subunit